MERYIQSFTVKKFEREKLQASKFGGNIRNAHRGVYIICFVGIYGYVMIFSDLRRVHTNKFSDLRPFGCDFVTLLMEISEKMH